MKHIRIRQLFKLVKLVNRWPVQSDIEHAALNIIFLLQS